MAVVNDTEARAARRIICEETVGNVVKFLQHIQDDGKLLEVVSMACLSNSPSGETDFDTIKRTHEWFSDSIHRLTILAGFLQGQYLVSVDENKECNIAISPLLEQMVEDHGGDLGAAWKSVEENGGWLGIVSSS